MEEKKKSNEYLLSKDGRAHFKAPAVANTHTHTVQVLNKTRVLLSTPAQTDTKDCHRKRQTK